MKSKGRHEDRSRVSERSRRVKSRTRARQRQTAWLVG